MKTRITITLLFAVLFAMFAAPAFAQTDDATSALQAAVAAVSPDYDYAFEVPVDVPLVKLGVDADDLDELIAYSNKYFYLDTGEKLFACIDGEIVSGDEQWISIDEIVSGDEQWISLDEIVSGDEQIF